MPQIEQDYLFLNDLGMELTVKTASRSHLFGGRAYLFCCLKPTRAAAAANRRGKQDLVKGGRAGSCGKETGDRWGSIFIVLFANVGSRIFDIGLLCALIACQPKHHKWLATLANRPANTHRHIIASVYCVRVRVRWFAFVTLRLLWKPTRRMYNVRYINGNIHTEGETYHLCTNGANFPSTNCSKSAAFDCLLLSSPANPGEDIPILHHRLRI